MLAFVGDMDETQKETSNTVSGPVSELPAPVPETTPAPETPKPSRSPIIIAAIIAIVGLFVFIFGIIYLLRSDLEDTARIRDIFIIFMALEFIIIGIALTVLMVQLATLVNLLQNEVKPILQSTNETANTLRGTVTFLSNNLTEPVIKLNEYMAGIRTLLALLRLGRR